MSKALSWNDRFALIDHYQPTDNAIRSAFNLTQDELDMARTLRAAGTFIASPQLDVGYYSSIFANLDVAGANSVQRPTAVQAITPIVSGGMYTPGATATVHTKPETATKRLKAPQKRGRKGDKIQKALLAVPETPMPVDVFIKQHDVSLAVLRQSKRFAQGLDPAVAAQIGTINVRQDKTTKQLMIWREVK